MLTAVTDDIVSSTGNEARRITAVRPETLCIRHLEIAMPVANCSYSESLDY